MAVQPNVYIIPNFVEKGLHSKLVQEIPFREVVWGDTGRKLPRLVASIFPVDERRQPTLAKLQNILCAQFGIDPNSSNIWCNLYRTGADYTPYHADNYHCTVCTISIGGTRDFLAKNNATGQTTKYTLNDGDLMVFNEQWNALNKHSVPKRANQNDPRISLVFFTA